MCMRWGSSGSTTTGHPYATDAVTIALRQPMATTMVEQTPMASGAAQGPSPRFPPWHAMTIVKPVTTATKDVVRQVVENQTRRHTAIRDEPWIEMVGKVVQEFPQDLVLEKGGEVPHVAQQEVTRQAPTAEPGDCRDCAGSCVRRARKVR